MDIKNKVFVVTGAGSGMGRELTRQLVAKGSEVALVDINEKSLLETAQLCGEARVSTHVLDITDKTNVAKFPEIVLEHHQSIDGLINNAGIIHPFLRINDLDYETMERVMNINFYGTVYMTKAFLPYLLERPVAHIANVSSMGGFIPFPGQGLYSASKAAVKTFTEALYSELTGTNVGVTVIHPGAVNTNIATNSGAEIPSAGAKMEKNQPKMLSADKAAEIMIHAIERNKFRVLVGKDASLLDKLYRLNPRWAVNMIVKKMGGMLK